MQVPEKLSLIGGSILLASTLIFTLKSQASSLLPKVEHPIDSIYSHAGDAQYDSEFGNGYKQAQKDDRTTGTWGTAKYYIDGNQDIHISSGKLQNTLSNVLGSDLASQIKTVDFDQDFQVPDDCSGLLGALPNITAIHGINDTDTSHVTSINWMFEQDPSLQSLDLSNWDPHLQNAGGPFDGDDSLHSLNVSQLNMVSNGYINMGGMFNGNHLNQITIGPNFDLWGGQGLNGGWHAPDGHTYDYPGGDHPGTWYRT